MVSCLHYLWCRLCKRCLECFCDIWSCYHVSDRWLRVNFRVSRWGIGMTAVKCKLLADWFFSKILKCFNSFFFFFPPLSFQVLWLRPCRKSWESTTLWHDIRKMQMQSKCRRTKMWQVGRGGSVRWGKCKVNGDQKCVYGKRESMSCTNMGLFSPIYTNDDGRNSWRNESPVSIFH